MQKGFTLIELLIVIGIIAVLSVVVLLTLNPAELLRQARDSNRLSDIGTMKSALALYLVDVSPTSIGSHANCYVSLDSGTDTVTDLEGLAGGAETDGTCGGRFTATAAAQQLTGATIRNIDGTGWIPVALDDIGGGAPLSALPVDPTNALENATPPTAGGSYYYAYRSAPSGCASGSCTQYELNANMESIKFRNGGSANVESTDGGNNADLFEVGTEPGLDI
ncbi:MAG: type II secretion system protein [Candidatus Liptonbacteria bacterium]|nr:type II secretion system protein [Candidatus Liptonbacteria bacterium]